MGLAQVIDILAFWVDMARRCSLRDPEAVGSGQWPAFWFPVSGSFLGHFRRHCGRNALKDSGGAGRLHGSFALLKMTTVLEIPGRQGILG